MSSKSIKQHEEKIQWGLEGIYVATTEMSKIDGLNGKLTIKGFQLENIAPFATYEEMLYLVWYDKLPNLQQLEEFSLKLKQHRKLPEFLIPLMKKAAENKAHPMDLIKLCLASMITQVSVDNLNENGNIELATKIVGMAPSILAGYWRLLEGNTLISPNQDLGHSANFLYMLKGEISRDEEIRALDTYQNCVLDHGFNASTFVARAIVSTDSDLLSGILGAIGSLKGPKHGGAPGPALDMIFEIGNENNIEPYIRNKLKKKERIMGFGHRVYKVRDPRAQVLSDAADSLYSGDQAKFLKFVKIAERKIISILEEYKPGRNLQTNVEFYTALVLHGCGLKPDIFSSIFAMSRLGGYAAHIIEQKKNNRLIRPRGIYIGGFNRSWLPLNERT